MSMICTGRIIVAVFFRKKKHRKETEKEPWKIPGIKKKQYSFLKETGRENKDSVIYVAAASEFCILSSAASVRLLITITYGLAVLSVRLLYPQNAIHKILMVCIIMKNFAFP